jgi:hypothetical protein
MNLVVEQIDFNLSKLSDRNLYNSNNHHDGSVPVDYYQAAEACQARHWIHKFRPRRVPMLTVSKGHVRTLRECHRVHLTVGRISPLFWDEIDEMVKAYEKQMPVGEYFVRGDHCSVKYGMHGNISHRSVRTILENIVSSPAGHCPLNTSSDTLCLYFQPWVDIHEDLEFRVFVRHNRITAISQQHLYRKNTMLESETVPNIANRIIDYHRRRVVPLITHVDSYCMDVALIREDCVTAATPDCVPMTTPDCVTAAPPDCVTAATPYFIEINPFGKEYSSGSSLFHWLRDEDKLYGQTQAVYFRYL